MLIGDIEGNNNRRKYQVSYLTIPCKQLAEERLEGD